MKLKKRLPIVLGFLLLFSLGATPEAYLPSYRYQFYRVDSLPASLEAIQQVKQLFNETQRGATPVQSSYDLNFSPRFSKSGEADGTTKAWLATLSSCDKVVLVRSLGAQLEIKVADVKKEILEYQNTLPDGLRKTLFYDLLSYVDKKNIYLALSYLPHTNGNLVRVQQAPQKTPDDLVQWEIEANEDSYVYVFRITGKENTEPQLIYPNPSEPKNRLSRGSIIRIPSSQIASNSDQVATGSDRIRIFSSKKPWNGWEWKQTEGKGFFSLSPPPIGSSKSVKQDLSFLAFLETETERLDIYLDESLVRN